MHIEKTICDLISLRSSSWVIFKWICFVRFSIEKLLIKKKNSYCIENCIESYNEWNYYYSSTIDTSMIVLWILQLHGCNGNNTVNYRVQSMFQSINYNRISLIWTLFIGTKFSSIPDQLNSNWVPIIWTGYASLWSYIHPLRMKTQTWRTMG